MPVFDVPPASGSRVTATNVRLAPLPYFPGPRQFYPQLWTMRKRLRAWVEQCDVIHLRVPSPAAIFAFQLARARRTPVFLLVVGDYRALVPHLPYRGLKKQLFGAYVAFEEWALGHMTRRALTFANGRALREKHERDGARVHETKTTTLSEQDIASRADTCASPLVRLLSVSRIDPRKGLRVLPAAVAALVAEGVDVALDIVGPTVGQLGEAERDAIEAEALRLGVTDRVHLKGPVALDALLPLYRDYDIFVLPTRPGEGIPRVLMEAMAAGVPVVTTAVSGIGSLITHGENGLLVDESSAEAVAGAVRELLAAPALRQRLIQGGYATARAHTLERQAAEMMQVVSARRICFVLPSLAGGGAERAAVQILNAMDERLWSRSMYLFAREGPYLGEVEPSIALAAGSRAGRFGRWQDLRRFIRRTRPEIVVSFLSYFTVLTAARAAGVGARVVFNQQTPMSDFLTDGDYHWQRRWHRTAFGLVARTAYAAVDLVVATSRGVAEDLAARFGVSPRKTRILPNPVDLARVRLAAADPVPPEHSARWQAPVIVAAGRLAEAKNYPLMIEALARLRASVPARLFILGQGELEPEIRQAVAARGLEDVVTLCGFQSNPWKYIARADVFVLTSRYEGFGNVLVEAMACGVPVVATASAGTRDIVTDGVDGVLVEAHTPDAVAAALERVLTDAPMRARMASSARTSAERFAVPVVARAYDEALGASAA